MYTAFLQISLASFISLSTFGAQFSANLSPGLAETAFDLLEKPIISREAQLASVGSIGDAIEAQARVQGVSPVLAKDIAFCESTGRQYTDSGTVLRGHVNRRDVGLFQINEHYHLQKSKKLGFDILTTEGNIGYAIWLLKYEGKRHWNASRVCWEG